MNHTEQRQTGVPFVVRIRAYRSHALTVLVVVAAYLLILSFIAGGAVSAAAELRRAWNAPHNEIVLANERNGDPEKGEECFIYLKNYAISGEKRKNAVSDLLMVMPETEYENNNVSFIGTLAPGTCAVSANVAAKYGLRVGDTARVIGTEKTFEVVRILPAQGGLDAKYKHEGIVVLSYDKDLLNREYQYYAFIYVMRGFLELDRLRAADVAHIYALMEFVGAVNNARAVLVESVGVTEGNVGFGNFLAADAVVGVVANVCDEILKNRGEIENVVFLVEVNELCLVVAGRVKINLLYSVEECCLIEIAHSTVELLLCRVLGNGEGVGMSRAAYVSDGASVCDLIISKYSGLHCRIIVGAEPNVVGRSLNYNVFRRSDLPDRADIRLGDASGICNRCDHIISVVCADIRAVHTEGSYVVIGTLEHIIR